MHRLVLIRHAKSDWSLDLPDHDRPLNPRGERDAAAVGAWLATQVDPVDVALVSSALRTQQTWQIVSRHWGTRASMRTVPALYESSARTIALTVEAIAEDVASAVLVGHNPGITDALALLTGAHDLEFKTSSIAVVQIPHDWATARGVAHVQEFVTPRG